MTIIESAKGVAQGLVQGAMGKLVPLAPDSWIPGGVPDPLIAHPRASLRNDKQIGGMTNKQVELNPPHDTVGLNI